MKQLFFFSAFICLSLLLPLSSEAQGTALKVGVTDVFAPMCIRNDQGKLVGYEVDLLQEIGKRINKTIELQVIDWSRKDELLDSRSVDLLASGLNVTPERRKIYAFTTPFIKNAQAIVVAADSSIRSKSDLAGKTVCMEAGTFSVPAVEKFKDASGKGIAKLEQLPGADGCLKALLDGSADASVQDSLPASYYVANSPGVFHILAENFGENEIAFGLRKTDAELLAQFDKALAAIKADGTLDRITEKWFGAAKKDYK